MQSPETPLSYLAKVGVEGSNPFARSNFQCPSVSSFRPPRQQANGTYQTMGDNPVRNGLSLVQMVLCSNSKCRDRSSPC